MWGQGGGQGGEQGRGQCRVQGGGQCALALADEPLSLLMGSLGSEICG